MRVPSIISDEHRTAADRARALANRHKRAVAVYWQPKADGAEGDWGSLKFVFPRDWRTPPRIKGWAHLYTAHAGRYI